MASGQLSRKENITERKIHGEKDNVPEMTTRVEHLSVKEKELPQGSVEASTGGEINKDRAGKAIGNAGERGKARESHELGPNYQSLPDRNENQIHLDRARVPVNANVAGNIVGENATRENATREKLDNRTRVVAGTPHVKEQNIALGKEQVVAERGGTTKDLEARSDEKIGRGRVLGAENQDAILEKSVAEERERARERERAKEATKETLNNTAQAAKEKGAQAMERAAQVKDATLEKTQQGYEVTRDKASNAAKTAAEKAAQTKDTTIEKGQQGYEATKDTVSNAAKIAAEKAAQAKDSTIEKGQQGYEATKDTVSNAAKTAAEKAAQAKNATLEKTQQGYEATKDTVSNAAKTAADYVTPAAEKTKSAVVQAKDVTVEKGKTAAEIAGKVASVAGWTATHYATQLTVDGTKAAASAVEGAVGYVAPKASELAAKSVETVKGLAASAGETAKGFTARKKDESWREYETQKASQPKEGEETLPSSEVTGQNVSNYRENVITQKVVPSEERTQAQGTTLLQEKGRGSNVIPSTAETETVENVLKGGEKIEKKALEKKNEGGSDDIKIAVTETKAETE
ncbi:unnamed protein product [Vicia faba]|uniref:Seed biotin-containing protein SBP65 n=1 Tax=Vicia faba TaxID=3906 RepID=A0AAV0Z7Z9_VICFA|nr:unnamed protein product [Vicia faba]